MARFCCCFYIWTTCLYVCSVSYVRLFTTLWTVAHQAPLSMEFPGKNTGVVAMPSSRGCSRPKDQTHISCTAGRFFTQWATWEAHGNNINIPKCPSGYVISNGERSNAKPGQGGAVAGMEWKEGCGGVLNSLLFLPPAPVFSFACSSAHLQLEEKPVFFHNCCSWC